MKLLDSNGGKNHIVPFSNGALKPPHVKRIGPALFLFLLLEDLVTEGEGTDGVVLRGRPVRDEELGKKLGVHAKTIAENRRRLKRYNYILVCRTGRGHIIRVQKSKKWAWLQSQRWSQNAPSQNRDGAKWLPQMEPNGSRRPPTLAPSRSDNTLHKHKTVLQPAKRQQADPRFQQVVDHYLKKTREVMRANPSWDGGDGVALNGLLKQHPDTLASQMTDWLDNAFASSDPFPLRQGFRFTEFARHHLKYVAGPLHRGKAYDHARGRASPRGDDEIPKLEAPAWKH